MSPPNPAGGSDPPDVHGSVDAQAEVVDAVARAVAAVDGVEGLHHGLFGEVGSYLPGRRVPGIRLHEDSTEVHVVVRWGAQVRGTADAVRRAVSAVRAGHVDVMIADVAVQAGSEHVRTEPDETGEEETS